MIAKSFIMLARPSIFLAFFVQNMLEHLFDRPTHVSRLPSLVLMFGGKAFKVLYSELGFLRFSTNIRLDLKGTNTLTYYEHSKSTAETCVESIFGEYCYSTD
jgi:hypothetical protein